MPCLPVPALALPELISNQRGECDKFAFAKWTGAAQNAFCVKTAAQVAVSGN